ncbi:MFS transporter [Megasphaera paucivorans]|uniref:Predicted arabinose efflux permease, MFS family n=1 Tax=Megasphaera paucivorans TaxID=349095 RepID=A0A1G9Y6I1_9FIRM|nr:MFS transporter [Megasphaera paucivorans]SDN04095.1 Predicted arabinose efflux permease, MFS family [Megasphaera paucivorans]
MMNIHPETKKTPLWITFLLAVSCGVIVANLYYAQPLVGPISTDTHIPLASAGFIVTLTQIGYVLGLLFIVPLSDLVENRRLVLAALAVVICALAAAYLAHTALFFLVSAMLIGIGSVATQILVPYAAHLATEKQRGQVVGNVMSGLLLGIMLARPVASMITDLWGWRAVFALSAVITTIPAVLLACILPKRVPIPTMNYGTLLCSLWQLFKTKSVLRRRSLYQACLFGAFSLFWTVVPLWLAHHFHLSQQGIALFAFAGVAGAIAAPVAGRLADRGWTKPLTGMAIGIAVLAFVITHIFEDNPVLSLTMFVIAAIALDMAVSGNLVLGQRAVYALGSDIRGRVNGIFMAVFFIGGAIGSAIGGWAYAYGSWWLASILGMAIPLAALLYYFTE